MGTFHFDPRMMVSGPFINCPKCHHVTFGILAVHDNSYDRRCKNCLYPKGSESSASYVLPELNKKIIYLDQFAISNMMKVLNPNTDAYKKGRIDDYWLRLYERLDSLCKMQLITCPDSEFHNNESLVTGFYKQLKRLYELLSHGGTFYGKETIKRFQLEEHFINWLDGKEDESIDIDVNSIVRGNINSWTDKFIISVEVEMNVDLVETIRRIREQTHNGLEGVFQYWHDSKITDFSYWYRMEIESFGKGIINEYLKQLNKIMGIEEVESYIELYPTSSTLMINRMQDILNERGIEELSSVWYKITQYFNTANFGNLPFLHLSASLFASIARKAGAGRKKPPNKGTANDIEMISTLLPYCDAMFIDNECASYMKEKPFSDNIGFPTRIFSQSNKEEFIEYLNEIESGTPMEHISKVNEVYGESWKLPYVTLYKD
ncbi:hypothetical protein AA0X95_00960 [Bacillus sp. 1P10SD]|uniref:hypothetical protein n=1 Tax=Bacillus sp. 1P10SD TaxID=3132265 RepID=UPI0039A6C655